MAPADSVIALFVYNYVSCLFLTSMDKISALHYFWVSDAAESKCKNKKYWQENERVSNVTVRDYTFICIHYVPGFLLNWEDILRLMASFIAINLKKMTFFNYSFLKT